ncbi:MAG TPA: hypothetical protein VNV44_09695 [Solirubrobacteraceae bacterium]|nr:hypothetical protein [Solirubrobacteraceae bacterium]
MKRVRIVLVVLLALASVAASSTAARGRPTAFRGGAGAQSRAATPGTSSLEDAYRFLYAMMDRYATGSQLRLVQSFQRGPLERRHYTDSVTYDDALVIDALLGRGEPEDLARAEVLGNSLLYVQAEDPRRDGRIRAAYPPTPLSSPEDAQATEATSDVGNMAWVGQALVQLYARTGRSTYLSGARALGEWIETNAYDTRGAGGYTGGESAAGRRIEWKSTEHNIDLYAFFTLLAQTTGESAWSADAQWARGFVESMWNPSQGMFWVGSGEDGVTPNEVVLAEDVNSWSYLALHDAAYAGSVDWDVEHLSVSRRGFSGVSFCAGSRKAVWFEGTAHLADALELRGSPGDPERARTYLEDVAHAQEDGANGDGLGVIAASKKLSNCEGEHYFPSLHTGATAWYLLALEGDDPFTLL